MFNEVTTLRKLEIGDRFIHARVKNKASATRFKVLGKPEFNLRAGTATRACMNETLGMAEAKTCNLQVIKLPINPFKNLV